MRDSKKKVFLFLFALVWCTLVAVNSYAADEFVIEGEISFGMDIERIQEIAKERGFGSSDYLSAWNREFRSLDYDNDVSYSC